MADGDVAVGQLPSLQTAVLTSVKRTHEMFLSNYGQPVEENETSRKLRTQTKFLDEYKDVQELPKGLQAQVAAAAAARKPTGPAAAAGAAAAAPAADGTSQALIKAPSQAGALQVLSTPEANNLLALRHKRRVPKAKWHPPWKLMRVISGHLGWVRSIAVDPTNEWFATGSADKMIKIWDLASGTLKLTLTGHINAVRGLCVSDRHPYLFSVGDDKMVKCWDLEVNKVVRHYHGHLSGVYCCALHPTLDVLVTGGRDASVRVWDIRTKNGIHVLTGHTNTVASVAAQAATPQIISGSMDTTVRLWDLAAGKTMSVLTNHKKSIRSVVLHPTDYMFITGAPDNIKQWKCPNGDFMQNMSGHNAVVNTLAINSDDVLFSGGDNGSMCFWDVKSATCFQRRETIVQPGSLDSEMGIFASTFDKSGSRLITCEADKTIKVWREDETAVPPHEL